MAQTNIYLADDLAEALRVHKGTVNVSAVCAEALRQEIAAREDPDRIDGRRLYSPDRVRESVVREIIPTRVSYKLSRSTQGVSLEVDVHVEKGLAEEEPDYVDRVAALMGHAYEAGEAAAKGVGLNIGPYVKAEAR